MLKEIEIIEIREHLEKAQNPLFYFDNDQDGLSSFLILRRFYNKGNGVPVKNSPLGKEYFRRIEEFNPDYVFILDQPTVSDEFLSLLRERNLPVVWIDHHEIDKKSVPTEVNYYNTFISSGKSEPVTKLCYEIAKKKEDLWVLIIGCISDKFFPEEYEEFSKLYPDLSIDSNDPFKIFYGSLIGKLSRMVGVGLKDRTSVVNRLLKFLINVKSPYEVLEENSENLVLHKRFNLVESKLVNLVNKAKEESKSSTLVFFRYSGEISMSADLSNKISYELPDKFVVVVFLRGSRVNLSIRGKDAKNIVEKAIKGIDFATFGGHQGAVGAQMDEGQLNTFEKNLNSVLNKKG
ncbi:MAG: hypothetical protein NUV46_04785 [Nanoarchaeota archaeon]|nr:hypothetical protein [Nanoarchaeota archaeon]